MAYLENVIIELQMLAKNLKLTVGNATEVRLEICRLTRTEKKFHRIKRTITEALKFEQDKNIVFNNLSKEAVSADLISLDAVMVNSVIEAELVARNLDNQEASLTDLQQKIDNLIAWGERLRQLAENILSNPELIKHLNQRKLPRLDEQVAKVDQTLKIVLAFDNPQVLKQQLQKLTTAQHQLMQIREKLSKIIEILNSSTVLIDVIEALLSFFGKSIFTVEWLDDDGKAFIDDAGQTKSVGDILEECISLKQRYDGLIVQANSLKEKAEEFFDKEQKQNKLAKTRRPIVIAVCILSVAGAVAWITWPKFSQGQQVIVSSKEGTAVAQLKLAQTLGMEAAKMVQSPHPVIVWQQSKAKWQKAINLLEAIPEGTSVSLQAKKQLNTYRQNYAASSQRLIIEQKALSNLESAQKLAMEAALLVQNPPHSRLVWQQAKAKAKWQKAINLLEVIPEGTFVSAKAKEKLATYRTKYVAIGKK